MTSSSHVAEVRADVARARRVVVKIGSSSLAGADGGQLDLDALERLVGVLAQRRLAGCDVVLVSSGAIASGIGPLGLVRRPRDLATQQAAASVGQGALIAAYAKQFGQRGLHVGQVLLTADDVTRRSHYTNAKRTLERLLDLGVVPIVNENDTVATQEIRFGDNDRLAALVAHLVGANALVLLTDVDALYDAPPSRPNAQRIPLITGTEALKGVSIGGTGSSVGSGGMVSKVDAAAIATREGVTTVLTSASQLAPALAGEDVGTIFTVTGSRASSRKLWLAHATSTRGVLTVDAGAVTALTQRGKSLLAAGITGISGTFDAGDAVEVRGPSGHAVARGLVNYSAAELPTMLGRSTDELAAALGAGYEREVIHRDHLALL